MNELIDKLADKTLSFGCRVYRKKKFKYDDSFEGRLIYLHPGGWSAIFKGKKTATFVGTGLPESVSEHYTILGHPVTLARVLLKLQEVKKNYDGEMIVDVKGTICELECLEMGERAKFLLKDLSCNWNLEQDDLTKQSKETIDFLTKLFL